MKSKSQVRDEMVAGAKVFKVKRHTAMKAAACASKPGIRRAGYGTILVAGFEAEEAFSILATTIRRLLDQDHFDPKMILALCRVQRLFNQVLLDSGKALLSGGCRSDCVDVD